MYFTSSSLVSRVVFEVLREHQRFGVSFMFNCLSGLAGEPDRQGCILADDMGLGKTLQTIAVVYTLLTQGITGGDVLHSFGV